MITDIKVQFIGHTVIGLNAFGVGKRQIDIRLVVNDINCQFDRLNVLFTGLGGISRHRINSTDLDDLFLSMREHAARDCNDTCQKQ